MSLRPAGTTIPRVWVLTDGKAGDEMPLIGVAEAMSLPFEVRRVAPRPLWVWLMPFGPIDPRERPERAGSPMTPPLPDICLATGRRAIAYARYLKRRCSCLTVLFKDPRTSHDFADLVFVQEHDGLRGARVIVTLTGPNRITPERLEAARAKPADFVETLPEPRIAVLVGGDTRRFAYTQADIERLVVGLREAAVVSSLMITASRRTPPLLKSKLSELARTSRVYLWDGTGSNPYMDLLANADRIVVTSDSTNMLGEAAATGNPVHVFRPEKQDRRFDTLIDGLRQRGIAHPWPGLLEGQPYEPLNETPMIAEMVLDAWRARQK